MKNKLSGPDLFGHEREMWLLEARRVAQELLLTHETITIELVLAQCPRPRYLHRNIIGQVFRDGTFKQVGFTKSKRAVSNGRIIAIWALNRYPSRMGQEL